MRQSCCRSSHSEAAQTTPGTPSPQRGGLEICNLLEVCLHGVAAQLGCSSELWLARHTAHPVECGLADQSTNQSKKQVEKAYK
jgi:hypothetical protein